MKYSSILFLAVLSSSSFALVNSYKPLVDARIASLDYSRPKNSEGLGGRLSVDRIKIKTRTMMVSIVNKEECDRLNPGKCEKLFDGDIILSPNEVFLNGNIGIGFPLDANNNLFKINKTQLYNGKVFSDDKIVSADADKLFFDRTGFQVSGDNFKLFCQKNPEYTDVDTVSLIMACANNSVLMQKNTKKTTTFKTLITSKNDKGVSTKLLAETNLGKVELSQSKVQLKVDQSKIAIDDNVLINLKNAEGSCLKSPNLKEFKPEQFFDKCLNNLALKTSDFKFTLTDTPNIGVTLNNASLVTQQDHPVISSKQVGFTLKDQDVDMSVMSRDVNLDCSLKSQTKDQFFNTCLLNSKWKTSGIDFSNLSLKSQCSVDIKVGPGTGILDEKKLQINTSMLYLDLAKDMFAYINAPQINCEYDYYKNPNNLGMFNNCKNESTLKTDKILIGFRPTMKETAPAIIVARPKNFSVAKQVLKLGLSDIVIANKAQGKIINNLQISCGKKYNSDLFDYLALALDCANSGYLYLDSLENYEQTGLYEKMLPLFNTKTNMATLITKKSDAIKELELRANKNRFELGLKLKSFGLWHQISFSGGIISDQANKLITLNIEKLHVPLLGGLQWPALKIMKAFLENDVVKINPDQRQIQIDLRPLVKEKCESH